MGIYFKFKLLIIYIYNKKKNKDEIILYESV